MLLGVRSDGAYVSASRSRRISRGGMALDVRMPHHLTFLADGDAARGDDDRHHGPQRDGRGRRDAARQDRVSPTSAPRPYAEQVVGHHPGRRQAGRARSGRSGSTPMKRKSERPVQGHDQGRQGRARSASRCGPTARPTSTASSTPASWSAPGHREQPVTEVVLVGTKKRAAERTGRRRPQLGGAGQLRVRRQPAGLQPGRAVTTGSTSSCESTWHAVGGVGLPDRRQLRPSRPTGRRSSTTAAVPGQWPVCGHYLFTDRVTDRHDAAPRCSGRPRCVRSPPGSASARPSSAGRTSSSTPTRCAGSCAPPASAADDVVARGRPGLGSLTLGAARRGRARSIAVEIDPVLAGALPRDRRGARARRTPTGSRWSPPTRCGSTALPGAAADRAGREPALQRRRCRCCCTCWRCCPSLRARAGDGAGRGRRPAGRAARARKVYGVPSVKAAWYADVRRAGVGRPQRLLAGAQRRLRPGRLDPPRAADRPRRPASEVFAVVDAAFAQRRKTLRAALRRLGRLAGGRRARAARGRHRPAARGEALDVARVRPRSPTAAPPTRLAA